MITKRNIKIIQELLNSTSKITTINLLISEFSKNNFKQRLFRSLLRVTDETDKYKFASFVIFLQNKFQLNSVDYQDALILYLTKERETKKPYTFLELGACDGVYKSNCNLLKDFGWTGLSVEANPKYAPDLKKIEIIS